jgi:hypothetical protein
LKEVSGFRIFSEKLYLYFLAINLKLREEGLRNDKTTDKSRAAINTGLFRRPAKSM